MTPAGSVVLTTDQDGEVRTVGRRQEVVVVLPEIPTSGFLWSLDVDGQAELVSSTFEPTGTDIGGGGHRRFVVRAPDSGRAALRAVLRQEWDPDHPAQAWSAALDVPPE